MAWLKREVITTEGVREKIVAYETFCAKYGWKRGSEGVCPAYKQGCEPFCACGFAAHDFERPRSCREAERLAKERTE